MRVAVATFILLFAVTTACERATGDLGVVDEYLNHADAGAVQAPFEPTVVHEQPPARSVLTVPPQEMLNAVRDGYRPIPDRRFLLAIAHADHLVTGAPAGEVHITWEAGRWIIHYREELVGELPELADFGEAAALLRRWIGSRSNDLSELIQERGEQEQEREHLDYVREQLEAFEAGSVAQAVKRVDQRWQEGARGAGYLQAAARGLTYLVIQTYDRLDIGDALPARAMAIVAVAQALTPAGLEQEEALLAEHMQYTAHARFIAAGLPPSDPARAYVNRDHGLLQRMAEADGAAPLVRYLYTLRLSEARDPDMLLEWTDRYGLEPHVFGLAQLKPSLAMGRFENDVALAAWVPYVALYDLWKVALPHEVFRRVADHRIERLSVGDMGLLGSLMRDGLGLSQATLATRFEQDLSLLDSEFSGPFLDAGSYRAYFTSHFYSGVWRLGRHVLDGLASASYAENYAQELEGSPEGISTELYRWYLHLAEAENGRPNTQDLLADITHGVYLGRVPLDRTYDELKRHLDDPSLALYEAGKTLMRRLDSRPANRFTLSDISRLDIGDLAGAEAYYRSIRRVSPHEVRLQIWLARFNRELDRLVAMVSDSTLDHDDRVYGLEVLINERPRVDGSTIDALAGALIRAEPTDWEVRDQYVEYLEDMGRYNEARGVIQDFFDHDGGSNGFPRIFARTDMARMYQKEGRYEDAWRSVEPVVSSNQAGAMGRGALILEALGDHEEARRLAERLVRRYPVSAWGRSVLAEVLWKQGSYAEVSAVLSAGGYPITDTEWREEVAEAFLAAFAGKPLEAARDAHAALIRGGIPAWILEELSEGVADADRLELAFAIQSQLPTTSAVGSHRMPLRAYGYLRDLEGEAEAHSWLQARIPGNLLNPFSLVIYGHGDPELLWTLVDRPEDRAYSSTVWLMRAAAFVDSKEPDEPHRAALLAHYREDARDDYHTMGAYLMGLMDEDSLLALALTPDRRCEIAFYLGLKAKSERRLEDAIDWFRVVLETGQDREYEHAWAQGELYRFASRLRSLAVQAAAM